MKGLVEWMVPTANANVAAPPMFPCLEDLYLFKCPQLKSIPLMAHISSKFKKLGLNDCDSLSHLSGKFQASTPLQYLTIDRCENLVSIPSGLQHCTALEELSIEHCNELDSVIVNNDDNVNGGGGKEWQSLREVMILKCSKLTCFPIRGLLSCTSLRSLQILDCQGLISVNDDDDDQSDCDKQQIHLPADGCSSSLVQLRIEDCRNLRYFPVEDCFCRLTRLQSLAIGGFSEDGLPAARIMDSIQQHLRGSLKELGINGWDKLLDGRLPDQIQYLTALTSLGIAYFNGMEALPDWLGNLSSLQTLCINKCENLQRLPSSTAMRGLSKLKGLYILECPLLSKNCGKDGIEWPKISHIPRILIDLHYIQVSEE